MVRLHTVCDTQRAFYALLARLSVFAGKASHPLRSALAAALKHSRQPSHSDCQPARAPKRQPPASLGAAQLASRTMPAPVAPAPSSRANSGRAAKQAAVGKATRSTSSGGSPSSAMQAGLQRSRLQFLLDIAHATFSQPCPPTPQQIDALRRTLSESLACHAAAAPPDAVCQKLCFYGLLTNH